MTRPSFFPDIAAPTEPQQASPVTREIDRVADRLGFVVRAPGSDRAVEAPQDGRGGDEFVYAPDLGALGERIHIVV